MEISSEQVSDVQIDSDVELNCNCNNTCSRKTTEKTRGCPCKTAKVNCTDLCTCGTKKKSCQNKPKSGQVLRGEPSKEARETEDEERVKEHQRIKEFLATLDHKTVLKLCTRALSRGIGSMEYVDTLLVMEDDGESDDERPGEGFTEETSEQVTPITPVTTGESRMYNRGSLHPGPNQEPKPDWCKCGYCRHMTQEIENRCCGRKTCITTTRRFRKLCLDPEVLELCIKNRADIRNDRENHGTSAFRKAAYRQFILERYGYLGKGKRKVAPSCIVLTVRQHYPSPAGIYLGFRPD